MSIRARKKILLIILRIRSRMYFEKKVKILFFEKRRNYVSGEKSKSLFRGKSQNVEITVVVSRQTATFVIPSELVKAYFRMSF